MDVKHFIKNSHKIRSLGEGTFGEVALYDTPKGRCVIKTTKLSDRSLGYPPDLLAELDVLVKLREIQGVINFEGVCFDSNDRKGFILLEPLDSDLYSWAKYETFDRRIKYLPRLISQIGDALMAMHKISLIHNDIKSDNILVKETSDGPMFKLADFGKATLVHDNKSRYGGITKYKPPYRSDIFLTEYWAFMVCMVETILGGRRMVNRDDVSKFYKSYEHVCNRQCEKKCQHSHKFDLKYYLEKNIGYNKSKKIPKVFWDFVNPILNDETTTIKLDLQKNGFAISQKILNDMCQNISTLEQHHPKFHIIKDKFKLRMERSGSLQYLPNFTNLFNKFLFLSPIELDDDTIHYYAEVAYIITAKRKCQHYRYFKSKSQFLEFQVAFLATVGFQIYVLNSSTIQKLV